MFRSGLGGILPGSNAIEAKFVAVMARRTFCYSAAALAPRFHFGMLKSLWPFPFFLTLSYCHDYVRYRTNLWTLIH